jgi:hypothetical protein
MPNSFNVAKKSQINFSMEQNLIGVISSESFYVEEDWFAFRYFK